MCLKKNIIKNLPYLIHLLNALKKLSTNACVFSHCNHICLISKSNGDEHITTNMADSGRKFVVANYGTNA